MKRVFSNRFMHKMTALILSSVSFALLAKDLRQEEYILQTGSQGEKRLDVLNSLVNPSTKTELTKYVRKGMRVLEIGSGTGEMSGWLAEQIGPDGELISIDNSQGQVDLTQGKFQNLGFKNARAQLASAYNLAEDFTKESFDLIFARFVFTHLIEPQKALSQAKSLLKKDGKIVIQDLIISHMFSEPKNKNIDEFIDLCAKYYKKTGKDRDYGLHIQDEMKKAGLKIYDYAYYHPLLRTENEKLQMMRGTIECKSGLLEAKIISEENIDMLIAKLKDEAKREELIVSFLPNMVVVGGN